VVLDEDRQEVADDVVLPLERLVEALLLLLGGEVGREEEQLELAAPGERVGELAELLADDVDPVVLLGDLEQRGA